MKIEEQVFTTLSAAAAVTALAPATRILPPGDHQNIGRPYIVHFPINAEPEFTHESMISLNRWIYQVSCFADSYATARGLAAAVVAALNGQHSGMTCWWRDQRVQYEPDVRVHHVIVEFDVDGVLT